MKMYECVRKSATEMDSWIVMDGRDGEEHSSTRGGKNDSITSNLADEYSHDIVSCGMFGNATLWHR